MAAEEGSDWLVHLYEQQGATLHRLVVLLGAEEQSGRIVRGALLALHRRGHRIIDPAERVEFLQEQVIHAARAVRPPDQPLLLPTVDDPEQAALLTALSALPPRMAELMVVSHYLSVFGPTLAGIMRMSLRDCNQRLEIARATLRANTTDGGAAPPAGLEALSQEVTASLRAAARSVQAPGTATLALELEQLGDSGRLLVGPRLVVVLTVVAVVLGLLLAAVSAPPVTPDEPTGAPPPPASQPGSSRSVAAQVRGIPIYYVGRQDRALYRELRDLNSTGDLVATAVEALLTVPPADPDYESLWNAGTVLRVQQTHGAVVIDLSADAYADFDDAHVAALARDQVVYTVTELVADPEVSVWFLAEGGAPPDEFRSTTGFRTEGIGPMPPLWITSPRNSTRLGAGPISIFGTVKPGYGEPMVRVTDTSTGRVVAEEQAQTASGANQEGWRSWSFNIELPVGTYEVSVRIEAAPTSGVVETKTFEVV